MTQATTHATIKHVSDSTFDQDVINASTPVLDEIAREYDGKITIAKMDIDANPATPVKYGIRGIPTVILYKEGQAQAQKVGALSKSQLTAFLDSHL